MATNLLISTPGIEYRADIEAHTAEDSGHVAENAVNPARSTYYKRSATGAGTTLDFDLGSGNDESPDHAIFCRFDKIIGMDTGDPTFTVYGDDNNSFSSAQQFSTFNIVSADLAGPDGEDLIVEFSPSQSERYWRARIDTTNAVKHEFTFVRIGNFLDLGRDPEYGAELEFGRFTANERRAAYRLSLTWHGITDANAQAFINQVVKTNGHPVFLYDQNDYLLNNKTLLCCFCSDHTVTATGANQNTITANFIEFI